MCLWTDFMHIILIISIFIHRLIIKSSLKLEFLEPKCPYYEHSLVLKYSITFELHNLKIKTSDLTAQICTFIIEFIKRMSSVLQIPPPPSILASPVDKNAF